MSLVSLLFEMKKAIHDEDEFLENLNYILRKNEIKEHLNSIFIARVVLKISRKLVSHYFIYSRVSVF